MSKILIVGEHKNGQLKGGAAELATAAQALGGELHGALAGQGSGNAAAALAALGCASVGVLDGDLPLYSSDGFASALADYARAGGFDYVLLQHSFFGRDLGARLAAKLNAGWINDVTAITGGDNPVFTKPLYAGKVLGKFQFNTGGVRIVTLRAKNIAAAAETGSALNKVDIAAPAAYRSKVTALEAKAEGMVDLKDADIIVSGGRGLGGPEGFEPLRNFAKAIGAALGASRATVDAGWIDHSHQVGQTGKVVNPQLYIACGISGAIQHLAGMQTSKCIVAINSNENAPIFKVADYGIVGDVFEVIPELQKQLVEIRNS